MTARTCPVHGEYSASGVCRWCEPETVWNPVWPLYRPTVADLPIQPPVVIEYQHAALRWERVARRWNYKHRAAGGLDDRERAYVWRAWLNQMERQYAYLTWTPGQPP